MILLLVISSIALGILLLLCIHLIINVFSFYRLRPTANENIRIEPNVSVLVPARNEEAHIEICVRSLLQQHYERLEVLVLDDQSSDATARIVQRVIDELPPSQKGRLQLLRGEPLPQGWVGKNFACYQLAQHAQGDYLLFTDADTVYAPETVRAVIACMHHFNVGMLTGQPAYELKGLGERLIMPLLSFRVFTLLPITLVRRRPEPVLAAGNGPLLCFQHQAYKAAGGHQAIKECILEDVSLARSLKAAGYRMVFVDAIKLVCCYMYASFKDTWRGFSRTFFGFYNYSLLAACAIIILDLALFVLPPLLLLLALFIHLPSTVILLNFIAYALAVLMRMLLTVRFTQSQRTFMLLLCLLHPVSIVLACLLLLNSIRWHYRKSGTEWKGRYYPS